MASSSSSSKSNLKSKMDKFLDSFDDNITLQNDSSTFQGVDRTAEYAIIEDGASLANWTELKRSDLSGENLANFDAYQRDGYVILPDVFSKEELQALQRDSKRILDEASLGENDFYGKSTRRAYNLLAKTRTLDQFLICDRVDTLVRALLPPNSLLGVMQMIGIGPGETAQKLHFDQQFGNSHPVRDDGANAKLVNFIVAIDDFTEDNGATVIVPGSHLWPVTRVPSPSDPRMPLTMRAGSVCCFSGRLWHGGGENRTSRERRAVICVFNQPWARCFENMMVGVPFDVQWKLPKLLRERIGWSLHHPFLGQIDFGHPMKYLEKRAKELEDLKRRAGVAKL
uniref:Fe2OG dioxygenase domain-containing protein n=1 Tax=Chromera velia CCMP2878 TaxID=1169474 RepID=A0A0G4EY04_9ALVE|eukprot:Cvel_14209.t1-p1 / transcript=Cvel_14209.t1 / gene=Cvel_14209 / organism=Chromera_velia_CCMP2878 / gene_product=Uncharacterized protein Mb3657, putative / transcript_product=Uncharacterized protein Mb3657, putative / location=Cvel_scaffold1002:6785-8708(-) / protein_length=339 / sequence_SO=supercontig / SO=protein_coding / is_pseudo=false